MVLFFAWDLGVIFLGIPSFKILRFRKSFFLKIQILRCYRKMCWLFPCIPISGGFFWLKSVKKCVCVLVSKIALLLVKNVWFGVKKGISELGCYVAPIGVLRSPKTYYWRCLGMLNIFVTRVYLTVCSYLVMCAFHSEPIFVWISRNSLLETDAVSTWVFVYKLSGCGLQSVCRH